ncbi:MAG: winged helix-turn-helix transcriptional regulator [Prevotella sp.]|nr:winged helix-turn-helix transcriptional regulator [Prevotella sp.]
MKNIEDSYNIKEGKERAYYSLLKYHLQFRKQKPNINDSLIDYSISYFSENMDKRKLALSYYLKARISNNKDAITYLKKAEYIAEKTDDNYLKMRIYNNIAVINADNNDYPNACKYGLKAIYYGQWANDKEVLTQCFLNLSGIYSNLGQRDSCLYYANKSFSYLDKAPNDQKASIYLNAALNIETTDTAKSREYICKSIEYRPTNNAYQVLAKLARDRKDYKLSERYLNEALKYCKSADWEVFVLYELAKTKELMGEHKEASILSQRVVKLNDSIEDIRAQDSIKEIQIVADHEHKEIKEVNKARSISIIVAALLTLIIAAVCTAYGIKRYKYIKSINKIKAQAERTRRSMEKQAEKHKKEVKAIKEESREKDKEIRRFDAKLKKIEEKQKMTAAKMQQREEDRKHKGMEIYNQIKSGTKVENWTKESMDCLIAYYGIVNPEFIKDISSKHGQVSEYKLTQMIMKKAGLTNKQISEQLGISESAVRTMASRAFKGKKGFS